MSVTEQVTSKHENKLVKRIMTSESTICGSMIQKKNWKESIQLSKNISSKEILAKFDHKKRAMPK